MEHPLSGEQIDELLKPINPVRITYDHKDGLARLKHEDIRRRLTQIFGPTGWGEEIVSNAMVNQWKDKQTGLQVMVFKAHVRIHIRDGHGGSLTFFDGVGIWDGTQQQVKRGTVESVVQAMHNVANAANSAAFCRAAINLGDQFGLSLYSGEPDKPYVGHSAPYTGVPEPEPVTWPTPAEIPGKEETPSVPAQATSPDEEAHADTPADEPDPEDTADDNEPDYTEEPDEELAETGS